MVFKLSKIVSILHFFADISKKSKAGIGIYEYASEYSCCVFLENGVGCCSVIYSLEDISV